MDRKVTFIYSLHPLSGVVFPYFTSRGRYSMTFQEAGQACLDQNATVATYDQLFEAWKGGLDWCNAGWLNDSTVQYPITNPRAPCGGTNSGPGVRNYGRRDKQSLFDVFCFASAHKGEFIHFLDSLLFAISEFLCWACLRKHNGFVKKLACMT